MISTVFGEKLYTVGVHCRRQCEVRTSGIAKRRCSFLFRKIDVLKCLVVMAGMLSSVLYAYDWSGSLLNNNANPADCDVLKNGEGKIVVYGTAGAYSGGHTKEQIFDGNADGVNNFFDPPKAAGEAGGCWAGIGFSKPKVAIRIRFVPRKAWYTRMGGCYIQGANSPDFSDAVTIHVTLPLQPSAATGWSEQWLSYPQAEYQAFRYFRLLAPNPWADGGDQSGMYGGNCTELEFYGFDAEDWPTADQAPAAGGLPELRCLTRFNGKMNIHVWGTATNYSCFEVQRRVPGGEYGWVAAIGGKANAWSEICFPDDIPGEVYYRIRGRNPNGMTDWTEFVMPPAQPNLGSYIGISGSYKNIGYVGTMAFDGDINNYADALDADAKANNVWFGLDLRSPQLITTLRYVCRSGTYGQYMEGAYFQTADDAAFTQNVQTIYTIPTKPAEYTIVTAVLETPVTARYIRYHAANTRYGNVAEIEFSSQIANQPTGLDWSYDGGPIYLTWNAYAGSDPRVNRVYVYRKAFGESDWTRIAELDSSATSFIDRRTGYEPVFFYALAYAGESVEGAKCPPVAAGVIRQMERDPGNLAQLREGVNVIWRGYPYKVDNTAAMALKVFDGEESTCADLSTATDWKNGYDVALGVDLGEENGFTFALAKVVGRPTFVSRLNGCILYGSNSPTGNWYEDCEPISERIYVDEANPRCTVVGTSTNCYRYVFLRQPNTSTQFWGNAMELQLFGFKRKPQSTIILFR